MKVLAGDIGGTKALLAVFEVEGDHHRCLRESRFETGRYEDFLATVRASCAESPGPIDGACFAVAGPILANRFTCTNLGWSVEIDRLKQEIGIPRTIVINDFCAVGHGIDRLAGRDIAILQTGTHRAGGAIALIGAGTGLGEAYLTREGDRYRVHPSEGGHCDFAPRTPREVGLLEYLRREFDQVSYERIVSGPGLVRIHSYIIDAGIAPRSPQVAAEMKGDDPAAVISRHALAADDQACVHALDLFVSIYGAEAGNLALKILATGGVYIAGGIAPQIIEKLRDGTFVRAFRDKGWHRDLLTEVPIAVILDPRVGLLGAASAAVDALSAGGI